MAANALWEDVVRPITGYDAGKREDVGKIGGTVDNNSALGHGWVTPKIEKLDLYYLAQNEQTKNPEYKPDRTISFYDDASSGNTITSFYRVTLSVPWSGGVGGADFSNDGVAGKYDWAQGKALEQLVAKGSSDNFDFNGKPTGVPNSVKIDSFIENARAFDAVQQFFVGKEPLLAAWLKALGDEDAAWRGTSADAFRELIDGVHLGYKNLVTILSAEGATASTMTYVPSYLPKSIPGKTFVDAANKLHEVAGKLKDAWSAWVNNSRGGWLPTHHLDYWLDQVAKHLNERNIARTELQAYSSTVGWGSSFGRETRIVGTKSGDFSIYLDPFGDLRTEQAWRILGQEAYKSWVAGTGGAEGPIGLKELDDKAGPLAIELNNALAEFALATSSFSFSTGFTDLKSRFNEREAERKAADAQREADRQKEEMEKKKEEMEKGLGGGGQPPPGLGPGGIGGIGGNNGSKGPGTGLPGGLKPPPGLDPNNPANKGPGTGLPGGLKPPPGLDLNGPGGDKNVVRNPDGSVSVRNPDGSYTTTYPDGRKETTPPGVIPPGLGLNPGGLPGSGTPPVPLKTVKGPDGSTTSYNQDGSRTITHKDGASTTIGRDGTVTTVNPGGSTTVLHRDGSQSVTYPDGTKTTYKPDGSSVTQYKNGTVVQRAADGTLTTTDAEGNKTVDRPKPGETVKNPDGSTTTYNKDGSATTVHANGIKTTVGADGTITTTDPDGTKTVSRLGQNTSTIQYADGSVAKVEKDGTVVTTYKDGSSTRLGPDGTYTTTDADGKKTTEHLNPLGGKAGAITSHNVDGSTTTRYPDGTVDQEYKDGRRKITYPDGRTVTTDADGRTVSVTGGKGSSGLGSNGSGGFDYLDRERKKSPWVPNLYTGGSGGGSQGSGGPPPPPPLNPNTIGNSFVPPGSNLAGGGGAGSAGAGGGSGRSMAVNDTTASRVRPNTTGDENVVRRPATTSGMMPMMPPPMGGMGGMGGGQGGQSEERERATWVSEDEDVWGTDEGGVAGVIGR
ncbi:AAWKG family protein [Streptomyces sp. NPDC003691]